jgi:hypothetical protein
MSNPVQITLIIIVKDNPPPSKSISKGMRREKFRQNSLGWMKKLKKERKEGRKEKEMGH